MNKTPIIEKLKDAVESIERELCTLPKSTARDHVMQLRGAQAAYKTVLQMVRDHRDWESKSPSNVVYSNHEGKQAP